MPPSPHVYKTEATFSCLDATWRARWFNDDIILVENVNDTRLNMEIVARTHHVRCSHNLCLSEVDALSAFFDTHGLPLTWSAPSHAPRVHVRTDDGQGDTRVLCGMLAGLGIHFVVTPARYPPQTADVVVTLGHDSMSFYDAGEKTWSVGTYNPREVLVRLGVLKATEPNNGETV